MCQVPPRSSKSRQLTPALDERRRGDSQGGGEYSAHTLHKFGVFGTFITFWAKKRTFFCACLAHGWRFCRSFPLPIPHILTTCFWGTVWGPLHTIPFLFFGPFSPFWVYLGPLLCVYWQKILLHHIWEILYYIFFIEEPQWLKTGQKWPSMTRNEDGWQSIDSRCLPQSFQTRLCYLFFLQLWIHFCKFLQNAVNCHKISLCYRFWLPFLYNVCKNPDICEKCVSNKIKKIILF